MTHISMKTTTTTTTTNNNNNNDNNDNNNTSNSNNDNTHICRQVLGGDARFKMVPGQKLPGWAARDPNDNSNTTSNTILMIRW